MWDAGVRMKHKPPSSTLKTELYGALFFIACLIFSCDTQQPTRTAAPLDKPYLVILGVAQDAGYPQAGQKEEWARIKNGTAKISYPTALGLVDPVSKERWLF